jgi:hypothetical protein
MSWNRTAGTPAARCARLCHLARLADEAGLGDTTNSFFRAPVRHAAIAMPVDHTDARKILEWRVGHRGVLRSSAAIAQVDSAS